MRIDTGELQFVPVPDRPGVEAAPLFRDAAEDVRLERWAPSAAVALPAPGGVELLVLKGSFEEGGEQFVRESWLRLPAEANLQAVTGAQGCQAWVKTGHLARVRGLPAVAIRQPSVRF